MTKTVTVFTDRTDGDAAGRHLGEQIAAALPTPPDAVLVFSSSQFDYDALLSGLDAACRPKVLVGSSSAGEFTADQRGTGTACALALRSDEIKATAGLGRGVGADRAGAAREVVGSFRGLSASEFPYRAALVMTDALAGHADDLVEQLTLVTAGKYQFAGGGAGDDAKFTQTHVFFGVKAYTDAVVALELLSTKPMGVGVGHGWIPAGDVLRVTETSGATLVSLNGFPAVEAFESHAAATGQAFDRNAALPFFLHNILGIDTGAGYRLRVPLGVNEDGSVSCAAEIPRGARVCIMKTTAQSAVSAAANATDAAIRGIGGEKPGAAIFFDCVATRLRLGDVFGFELDAVAKALDGARMVGCNTYGQIARADGQFGGFHNCTAVVLVLPS
jgi:hypothetical protein